ncbi:hypothetical protein BKA70DRAFT_1096974, partial [Coprinopsis sp. MPI-PUGE-AT-0042]
PAEVPTETLAAAFYSVCGFFRDPTLNFTADTQPDAYRLVYGFRPSSIQRYPRFKSAEEQFLLKPECLQIAACFTLGLLAWDKKDRASAAKRYQEAIDLAKTDPTFDSSNPLDGIHCWDKATLNDIRDNLAILVATDTTNAGILRSVGIAPGGISRREEASIPNVRVDARAGGQPSQEETITMATYECFNCGKRGASFRRCKDCDGFIVSLTARLFCILH